MNFISSYLKGLKQTWKHNSQNNLESTLQGMKRILSHVGAQKPRGSTRLGPSHSTHSWHLFTNCFLDSSTESEAVYSSVGLISSCHKCTSSLTQLFHSLFPQTESWFLLYRMRTWYKTRTFNSTKTSAQQINLICCQETDLLPTREDKHYSDMCAHSCLQILNTEVENCIWNVKKLKRLMSNMQTLFQQKSFH